jgi:hypothetical protein
MKRGRPTKLSPQTQAALVAAVRSGCFLNSACNAVGVSYKVFRDWMVKGELAESGVYRDFRDAIALAEAKLEVEIVASWREQARTDWRAAASYLALRFPQRWTPTASLKIFMQQEIEIEVNLVLEAIAATPTLSDEIKRQIFALIEGIEE